jgi:hypothetical protein
MEVADYGVNQYRFARWKVLPAVLLRIQVF